MKLCKTISTGVASPYTASRYLKLECEMKKLLAVFATVLFCQVGHAVPVVPGAVDLATNDGKTYYALVVKNGSWYIDGYNQRGNATGYSVALTSLNDRNVSANTQTYTGLAFDGTSFYALRNDSQSSVGTDSWSVVGFGANGQFNTFHQNLTSLNGNMVSSTRQSYVGLGWGDGDLAGGGFYVLRDNVASATSATGYTIAEFGPTGGYTGSYQTMGMHGSGNPYLGMAVFAASPNHYEVTTNVETPRTGVPGPASGLAFATLLLGLAGRRMMKKA